LVVIGIHQPGDSDLMAIAHAGDRRGPALGLGKGGQKQRGQDGDDQNRHPNLCGMHEHAFELSEFCL